MAKNPESNYLIIYKLCESSETHEMLAKTHLVYTVQLCGHTCDVNEAQWTSPIELYKRGLDCKGINTGQNGVEMIASGLWAAFGRSSESCTCMYPHATGDSKLLYTVTLNHSSCFLIAN